MLRGTYQQMAHNIWQHKVLKVELMKVVIGATAAECSELCSPRSPPWQDGVVVMICCNFIQRHYVRSATVFCLVRREKRCEDSDLASKCCFGRLNFLRERSRGMDAMPLLVSTIIKASGSQVYFNVF